MKLSTQLLIGLALILVGCMFASNMLLKKQYDSLVEHTDKEYPDYKTVLEQPFKHVKISGGLNFGQIYFESSSQYLLKIGRDFDAIAASQVDYSIEKDTLFIEFKASEDNNRSAYYYDKSFLIAAPSSMSFDVITSKLYIRDYNPKAVFINLSDRSIVDFAADKQHKNLDTMKITSEFSTFSIKSAAQIQHFEANLDRGGQLDLLQADIKTLKINADDNAFLSLTMKQWQSVKKKE